MGPNFLGKRTASQAEEDKEKEEEGQPEDQDPAVGGAGARHLKRKRKKRNSTRGERAKIRILAQHGISSAEIATRLDRCVKTVQDTLLRRNKKTPDDGDDYHYVDSAFTAQYPPIPAPRGTKSQHAVKQENASNYTTVTKVARPSTSVPPNRITRSKRNAHSISVSSPLSPSQVPTNKQSTAGPSGQQSEPIDLVSDEDEPCEDMSISITDFLSGLAHDIAWVHEDLEKQDLGTMEKLLALADWPEEDLHMMFKEALPGITVPQRFILIKGLKKRQAEML